MTHFALWLLGLADPETQTTEEERACLVRHAKGRRRLVEIGVWHGVTSARLRTAMAADGVLYAVDPFPTGRLGFSVQRCIARREAARIGNGTVDWIRQTGADAGRAFAGRGGSPIDFLFIDGDHAYDAVRADWLAWSPQIAHGGIVALHDSRSTSERPIEEAGSVRFTREVVARDDRFEQIDAVDSLTVFRRKAT